MPGDYAAGPPPGCVTFPSPSLHNLPCCVHREQRKQWRCPPGGQGPERGSGQDPLGHHSRHRSQRDDCRRRDRDPAGTGSRGRKAGTVRHDYPDIQTDAASADSFQLPELLELPRGGLRLLEFFGTSGCSPGTAPPHVPSAVRPPREGRDMTGRNGRRPRRLQVLHGFSERAEMILSRRSAIFQVRKAC
jgi:hypothetical protein